MPAFEEEGTSSAWEAEVMPLYDIRMIRRFYLMWSDGSPVVVEFHLRMGNRTNIFFISIKKNYRQLATPEH
jgi:hypothetical protein